jgi:glutaryl-CoA dehydrogenase
MVQDSVARFVDAKVLPVIRDAFEKHYFPKELIPQVAELGLLGSSIEGYDCAGLNSVSYGLICQELERGDSAIRSFVSVQGSLVMWPILTFGSDEQKDRWLPALQQGKAIGCFGLTEPEYGSNPAGMLTTAVRDGDSFLLNGEKTWITNGALADVAVVWAKLDGEVRGFLVENGTPGFTTSEIHGKWSMRASVTSSLSFADCRIPAANALPGAIGLKAALKCLSQARFGIGWGVIGAAMECYEATRQYTLLRKQFGGRPIASHQLVQAELAWMISEISKAQLLAMHVSGLKSKGRLHPSHISLLKRNNVWMALEVARRCRDLLGANGITDEYPVFRHMANLESVYTYEGTDHMHTLILGEAITGIAAYR